MSQRIIDGQDRSIEYVDAVVIIDCVLSLFVMRPMFPSSFKFPIALPLVALSASAGLSCAGLPCAWAQNPTPAPLPTVSIKDAKVKEGNSGLTNLEFRVELKSTPKVPASVSYRTFGRTANSSTDFVNVQGVVNFPVGVRNQIITVKVKGDTKLEDNETLMVKLSGAKKLTLADSEGLGVIINDDGDYTTAPGKSKVVYATQDWFDPGIVIMNADGTNPTRLTHSFYDSAPIWSPDGKKVVYRSFITIDGVSGNGLAVVDATGKNQRPLYIDNVRSYGRAQWTADSKSILCTPSNGIGLVKVSVADAKVTTLVSSGTIAGPTAGQKNGKILYYAYDNATADPTYHNQIFIMNADGTGKTRLTSDTEADNADPQVSVDGKVITYIKRTPRTIGMYVMDGDGKNQRLLVDSLIDGYEYSVEGSQLSSDGRKALFPVYFENKRTFYFADVRTGAVRELPVGDTSNTSNPDLSSNGSQIVFHSAREGNYEIYIINSDGTKKKRLTTNEFFDVQPDITDGAVLAPTTSGSSSSPFTAGAASAPSANNS